MRSPCASMPSRGSPRCGRATCRKAEVPRSGRARRRREGFQAPKWSASSANPPTTISVAGLGTGSGGGTSRFRPCSAWWCWGDRKAVARYAGLTGSPDESGARRREQGLARAGNARVRRGMIQLAWRFLRFQKQSALAQWYRARTADSRLGTRKTMIVALARKLLIALWRFVTTGETLDGVILRPAG